MTKSKHLKKTPKKTIKSHIYYTILSAPTRSSKGVDIMYDLSFIPTRIILDNEIADFLSLEVSNGKA